MAALAACLSCWPAFGWEDSRLTDPVRINGLDVPYPVFSIFVMPGTNVLVGMVDSAGVAEISFNGSKHVGGQRSLLVPDQPGVHVLEVRNATTGELSRINIFALVPERVIARDGTLNGYRMGSYPQQPLQGREIYLPPDGFVEVTEANLDTPLSPNFMLREFISKQTDDFPKYLHLRSELLLKLESILEGLNHSGYPISDFVIMSGYRTPWYNKAIGNVPYSRHVYGGAADIYIDESPVDGVMDDLNGDGRLDRGDALWLADFIDAMAQRGEFGVRIGGLGVYGNTSAHGAFVHLDVRGNRARW